MTYNTFIYIIKNNCIQEKKKEKKKEKETEEGSNSSLPSGQNIQSRKEGMVNGLSQLQ